MNSQSPITQPKRGGGLLFLIISFFIADVAQYTPLPGYSRRHRSSNPGT